MFQYESEKRPTSAGSCDSRATVTTDWGRVYPKSDRATVNIERARRPLPPRPIDCERIVTDNSVPLKVWIIASASCFAVCAALVLATIVITRWGTGDQYTHELYAHAPEPIYSIPYPQPRSRVEERTEVINEDILNNDIDIPILEKLAIFKNYVANRDKKNLVHKHQIHPIHDLETHHTERKIEKKDSAKLPEIHNTDLFINQQNPNINQHNPNINYNNPNINNNNPNKEDLNIKHNPNIPVFKPTLPVIFGNKNPENYFDIKDSEFEDYYNDENLYEDYMQSNTMTSYLIEKVQELHDWVVSDPDFKAIIKNQNRTSNNFGNVLKALNASLIEGNVTIVMSKLKDIYFGDNFTNVNNSRKAIKNNTDLLSFGILTLDIMLLHNIQLMAWENQEAARIKMLKDPNVFAFNALFMDPTKIETKQNEISNYDINGNTKRTNQRQESAEESDFGKNLLENIMEFGMSTARAAIHLGRAYKNTRTIISQISSNGQNRDIINANIQSQLSRNVDGNTQALSHLQSLSTGDTSYTQLDCVWLLYCRNLIATSELNAPYSTMARINGMALRMVTGELAPDRALDTMMYELLTGWTDLKCDSMFPRCAEVDAASVVLDSILPVKRSHAGRT